MACEGSREPARAIVESIAKAVGPPPRLLGIDGRSGSGKSWLAGRVCRRLDQAGLRRSMVVMDDLYAGWGGLVDAPPRLCAQVIDPLLRGEQAAYSRYDWSAGAFTDSVDVPRADVVVIEGVGSTWHRQREAFALTVWVQAPADLRHERACARTGQGDFAAHAQHWTRAENALFGPDGYPVPPAPFGMVVDTGHDGGQRHG